MHWHWSNDCNPKWTFPSALICCLGVFLQILLKLLKLLQGQRVLPVLSLVQCKGVTFTYQDTWTFKQQCPAHTGVSIMWENKWCLHNLMVKSSAWSGRIHPTAVRDSWASVLNPCVPQMEGSSCFPNILWIFPLSFSSSLNGTGPCGNMMFLWE